MTASKQCKKAGLKSLAELAQITGRSIRTLQEWHKTSPVFFKIVLDGAIANRFE